MYAKSKINENIDHLQTRMQTQFPQMNKKNRITVPFYSPPSRLYGQTPAEIIKEARAAVMSPPAIGIKPVFTSRPFTPKEKERTLFGNMKNTNGRPPSSFSLRNLKCQEPGSRVKLPSIEVVSKRMTYPTSHYSSNLSLDNLTEDYDAEVFEETKSINPERLPTWKLSHSSSLDRRMVKLASYDEVSNSFIDDDSDWNKSEEEEKSNKLYKSNSYDKNEVLETSHDLGSSTFATSESSAEQQEALQFDESSRVKKMNPFEETNDSNPDTADENSEMDEMKPTNEKGEDIINLEQSKSEVIHQEKKNSDEKAKESIQSERSNKEMAKNKENSETLQSKEEINSHKNEKVAEKAMVTDSKSDYLLSLKKGHKSPFTIKQPDSMPLEILELYETARYYGVGVDERNSDDSLKGFAEKEKTNNSFKSVEDYFGEKSNDFLNQLKDNFNAVEEKMKSLNESSEKFHRKLASKSEINGPARGSSSGNTEFVMNNKKRYHVVGEKGDAKEKAYKKWNDKQEENSVGSREHAPNESWDLFWKNSYFRGKEEDEGNFRGSEKNKRADAENLSGLINRISGLKKIGADDGDICETTSQLYNLLKTNKMVLDDKSKEKILKALYLYVDNENPEVLLNLARLLLSVRNENSLSVACKIIFKVARFDSNDALFLKVDDILELFLEGIGRASPLDCAESCIYSYGALKFLTMNHNILSRILHMGALDLMTLHLKMINNAHAENGRVDEQTQHALFQLTGTLRHVAAGEGALPLFLTTNCIAIVCRTLELFHKDEDVIVNISRTLSLLSTDESVIRVLMSVENILNTIIDLMERYKENDKILIRLSFCLGNVVEHSDLARVQLSRNDGSLTILLNILKLYIDKDLELSVKEDKSQNPNELSPEVVDDVIVKVIRIIANMSMNPIVGSNLSPATNEKKSLKLSKLLSVLLMRKDPGITLLATLGCLNNISYYCNAHSVLIDITQGVERVLGLQSEECQAEAARVLGNLTRHKEIRDLIYNTQGVNLLIKLLSSQDHEVVRCACGALVNMMLDSDTRKCFVKAQGIDKLVQTLESYSGDWFLASLAIRVIWNSCADDLSSAVSHNNVEHLLNILANSLEEENWNDGDAAWEEFASIATDLLEKISSHLESTS